MSHTNKVLMAIVLFCGLTLISGQVSAADGQVSGAIAVGGNPLATGRIMFHTTDGQFVGSKIKNGKYAVDQIPTGTRKVTIEGDGVPAKYSFDDKSPLTVEVIEGENTLDFVIQ